MYERVRSRQRAKNRHFTGKAGTHVADNSNGFGSGTLVLSFITGLAAGVATVLLYTAKEQSQEHQDHQEEHLFI
jgi:hypothetical protein